MHLLLDPLPEAVTIANKSYPMRTDFATVLRFLALMQDEEVDGRDLPSLVVALFFDAVVDTAEALPKILAFFRCEQEAAESGTDGGLRESHAVYDFAYDAELIYAAFLQQYRIDLTTEDLHWYRFRALFHALTEDTQFMKVVRFRAVEITADMSKTEKKYYAKMKRAYALPERMSKSEQEQQDAITEALLGGGDLSNLTE